MITPSAEAGLWGLLAGSSLVLGVGLGWFLALPARLIAAVMAFGAGVLIAALAFELIDEAFRRGGLDSTGLGLIGGAAVFTLANWILAHHGARHRKRSGGDRQPSEQQHSGSGIAIALGALLDGIPEGIVIGMGLLQGGAVSMGTVFAVFVSNIPESLSSAAGMKRAGRSAAFVFGLWCAIAAGTGVSAWAGAALLRDMSPEWMAVSMAVAAGAILAMVTDTMIPEAFEETHDAAGLVTAVGFLAGFMLSKLSG